MLLRFACAWMASAVIARVASLQPLPNVGTVAAAAVVVAIGLGVGTRLLVVALALIATALAFTTASDDAVALVARTSGFAALGLLGPGAYSIDANLFGRRVIRLDPRPPDRFGDS